MPEQYYNAETLEPERSVGFLIKRCGVLMSQLAEERFESQQISFTQWLVLIKLHGTFVPLTPLALAPETSTFSTSTIRACALPRSHGWRR